MNFEYSGSIYIGDRDFGKMVMRVPEYTSIMDLDNAIRTVVDDFACGLDDCEYYCFDFIADDVESEVKRRYLEFVSDNYSI